jgi:hypothetical protein
MQVGDTDVEAQARIEALRESLQQLGWDDRNNLRLDIAGRTAGMILRENLQKSLSI